jgi:hypothetical protein
VLCHRQKFGLPTWVAEKGVRYRKPERPKGCFASSVPDPFFPSLSPRARTSGIQPKKQAVTKHCVVQFTKRSSTARIGVAHQLGVAHQRTAAKLIPLGRSSGTGSSDSPTCEPALRRIPGQAKVAGPRTSLESQVGRPRKCTGQDSHGTKLPLAVDASRLDGAAHP